MQSRIHHDLFAEFFDEFTNEEYGSLIEFAHRKSWSESERDAVWERHSGEPQLEKVARRAGNSDAHWERLYKSLTQLTFDL